MGPFFFSQFISSWITRLSHTSEEGEDHTRASVTLCFTNEACTLRLLAFALLPFETATTWRYNTLAVFSFSKTELRAVILFVCHSALSRSFLHLFKKLKWQQTWHRYSGLCAPRAQRFRFWPERRGGPLEGRWWFNKFSRTFQDKCRTEAWRRNSKQGCQWGK